MKDGDRTGPGRQNSLALGTSLTCSGIISKVMVQKGSEEVV